MSWQVNVESIQGFLYHFKSTGQLFVVDDVVATLRALLRQCAKRRETTSSEEATKILQFEVEDNAGETTAWHNHSKARQALIPMLLMYTWVFSANGNANIGDVHALNIMCTFL